MISCYLMYSKICGGAEQALKYFSDARTENGKGVTIPSQIRYVYYYDELLKIAMASAKPTQVTIPTQYLDLKQVFLFTTPNFDVGGGCDPFITVHQGENHVLTTKPLPHSVNQARINILCSCTVVGDVKITLLDRDQLKSDDCMGYFWFHTGMIHDNSKLRFALCDLDGVKKKSSLFEEGFKVEIDFERQPT